MYDLMQNLSLAKAFLNINSQSLAETVLERPGAGVTK